MIKQALTLRDIQGSAADAGDKIKGWYENVNPEARKAVLRGLAGSAIGAGLLGSIAAAAPSGDADYVAGPAWGPAALGAILGGTAAAGLPAGLRYISGGMQLPGEKKQRSASNTLAGAILSNPGKAIAGGYIPYALMGTRSGSELMDLFTQTARPATAQQIVERLIERGTIQPGAKRLTRVLSKAKPKDFINLEAFLKQPDAGGNRRLKGLRNILRKGQETGHVATSVGAAQAATGLGQAERAREVGDILRGVAGRKVVPGVSSPLGQILMQPGQYKTNVPGKIRNIAWRIAETWRRGAPGSLKGSPRGLMIGLPAAAAGGILADKLLKGDM